MRRRIALNVVGYNPYSSTHLLFLVLVYYRLQQANSFRVILSLDCLYSLSIFAGYRWWAAITATATTPAPRTGVLKQNINPEIIIILLNTIFLLLVIGAVSLVESYLLSESSISIDRGSGDRFG